MQGRQIEVQCRSMNSNLQVGSLIDAGLVQVRYSRNHPPRRWIRP
jgi:hypothetical protein